MILTITEIKRPEEVAELFPIVKKIWSEVFTPIIGEKQVAYMLEHYQSEKNINEEIAKGVHYFSLNIDEKIVGYIAHEVRSDTIFISKLYIDKDHRGQGLMSQVFDWYDRLSETLNRKQQLKVNQKNQEAIAVYQHRGFTIKEEVYAKIGEGFVMDDFLLEK